MAVLDVKIIEEEENRLKELTAALQKMEEEIEERRQSLWAWDSLQEYAMELSQAEEALGKARERMREFRAVLEYMRECYERAEKQVCRIYEGEEPAFSPLGVWKGRGMEAFMEDINFQ